MMRFVGILFLFAAAHAHAQEGWLLFRGNAQRTGADAAGKPWDKRPAWRRELLIDKYPIGDKQFIVDPDDAAKTFIDDLRKGADPSILPGSFPLIVDGMCVYRSYRDVRAVALQNFDIKDEKGVVIDSLKAGEIAWKSVPHDASLGVLLEKPSTREAMVNVVKGLQAAQQQHYLWSNPTIGAINSDGKTVFAVSDCAFPSPMNLDPKLLRPELKPFATQNNLIAYDVITGKIMWETRVNDKSLLPDSLFLGAPFPYAGKLYALNEAKNELRLVSIDLDWKKWKVRYQPDIEKTLVIANVQQAEQALNQPMRRTQSLQIAAAGEVLVCPTNAGVLIGVDRVKMTELWQYRYRAAGQAPALPSWQAAGPIVSKDRIVMTAADASDIHCIDFTGKKKWTAEPNKDLYVATVHDDIVLVVGKTHCRGLSLADGSEKWQLETGMPAGVGVKVGSSYHLPLQLPAGPARWVIDIAKGTKVGAVNAADVQGNMASHRGMFVSQTALHVSVFDATPTAK